MPLRFAINFIVILALLLAPSAQAVTDAAAASTQPRAVEQPPLSLSSLLSSAAAHLRPSAAAGAVTQRVSVGSGGQANYDSASPFLSIDGRIVVFASGADNLVPGDTNGASDIFLRDTQSGVTERLSVSTEGVQGDGGSYNPSISADGRYVVFESIATNLTPGEKYGAQVYLRDWQNHTTEQVSLTPGGAQPNDASGSPSVSNDGRYVAFTSYATNLVPVVPNSAYNIFLRDRQEGTNRVISVSERGVSGNFGSYYPVISADGRFVAYTSDATNLVPGDTNQYADVFLRDWQNNKTERISVNKDGVQGNSDSYNAALSADGRYVAFDSSASNLVPDDTNGSSDIFVRDRKNNVIGRVSVASDGSQADYYSHNPSISLDGRYVAFESSAGNLVPGDGSGWNDVFLRDRQEAATERISVSSSTAEGNSDSSRPSVSADGRRVAFLSYATNLVSGDTNGSTDIFLRSRCPDGSCGGMAAQPQISASPAKLIADGTATAVLTLIGAEAGHTIRLHSGRESGDVIGAPMGVVDDAGRYSTTIRSSVPGYAVLSVEDMSAKVNMPISTMVTFTDPSGKPLPPPPTGDVDLISVDSSLPLDGRYWMETEATNKISINVDWKGTPPGYIEYAVNGVKKTISVVTYPAMFEIPMIQLLLPGQNYVSFTAISILGKRSAPRIYNPTMTAPPEWLKGLLQVGMLSNIMFVSKETTTDFTWPKEPWHIKGGPYEVNFKFGGTAKFSLSCNEIAQFNIHGGLEVEGEYKTTKFGGSLEAQGEVTAGVMDCWMPTAKGDFKVKVVIYGQKNWPVLIFIMEMVNPAVGEAVKAIYELVGLDDTMDILGHVYVRFSFLGDYQSEITLTAEDPMIEWSGITVGVGIKPEAGYEYELESIGLKFKTWLAIGAEAKFFTPERTLWVRDLRFKSVEGWGEFGYNFQPPLLDCSWEDVYFLKLIYTPEGNPDWAIEAGQQSSKECSLFGGGQRAEAVFYGTPDSPQAFDPRIQSSGQYALARRGLLSLFDTQTASSVLVSNVYRRAEPALAVSPDGNQALLLWVHDDTSQPLYQSHEIEWSPWNGSSWSAPAAITRDSYLDAAPQVAWSAGGNAVATWVRLPQALDASSTWNEATAQKFEIATATYNASTKTWSAPTLLTTNAALDLYPALARSPSGKLLAAWKQNDAGKLIGGAANPDRIIVATYENGAWSTPAAIVENIAGINDLSASYSDNRAVIAYTQSLVPSSGGDPQQQVSTITRDGATWGAPVQQTDEAVNNIVPRLFFNDAGQAVLVWLAGSELRLRNLATAAQSVMSVPEDVGTVNEFNLVEDASGNHAVVFTAQAATQRDLFLAFYDQQNNVWGAPRRLTDDTSSEFFPATGLDASGRLLAGYVRTAQVPTQQYVDVPDGRTVLMNVTEEGPSDLMTLSHAFNRNLSIAAEDLAVSNPAPKPGETITLSANVHNTGDLAMAGVTVEFYNGDPASGGTLLGSSALAQPLPGQSAAVVNLDTPFDNGGTVDFYAVVNSAGAFAESDETDNAAHLPLFLPDLTVTSASVEYWGGSQYGLKATITNQGSSPSAESTLRFNDPANSSADLASTPVPALGGGESTVLTLPWQNDALAPGSYIYTAAVDPLAAGELDTTNNQADLTLDVRPNLAVSPYTVWVEDWTAATKQASVQVLNTGALDAQDVVVSLYSSAHLAPAFLLASQAIPLLPSGSAETLTFTLDADLPCGLYALVNPDSTIPETTRADNLARAENPTGGTCASEQDWTPPAAPIISEPVEGAELITLMPTFHGIAEQGSTVMVLEGDVTLCSAAADVDTGAWSCQPAASMLEGAHAVIAQAEDAVGNVSAPTGRAFTLRSSGYPLFLPMVKR